jgi:hypothetical protein
MSQERNSRPLYKHPARIVKGREVSSWGIIDVGDQRGLRIW